MTDTISPDLPTAVLAAHASRLDADTLDAETRRATIDTVADALACAIGGSAISRDILDPIEALTNDLRGGRAVRLVDGAPLPPVDAAFVNAAASHSIDYDDTHMAVVAHLGASVVNAALAACLDAGADGATLLAAVVAGFDVGATVGRAVMPQHYQRWHCTASLGGIASAAAAARAYGLDPLRTEMAIGIAADDTGGTRVCIRQGDITKSLHAAEAASKGVRAAQLVRAGAVGPTGHLEHEFGFFWAYSDERNADRLVAGLGALDGPHEILHNDIKAHPCILSSHTAVEGVVELMDEHSIGVAEIERVVLYQPPYSERHGLTYEPATSMAARLSVPFVVAAAMRDGRVGLAQFESGWDDPDMRRIMRLVDIVPEPALADAYPGQAPNRVEIIARGRSYVREVGIAKGSHQRPMSQQELRAKHDELLAYRFDETQIERWHRSIQRVADGAEVGVLVDVVTGSEAS